MKILSKIRESNGFLTATGEYLNKAEWHGFMIGLSTAVIGGPQLMAGLYGLIVSGKKLTGHLKDAKKEFAYTITSFTAVEGVQWLLTLL